MTTARCSVNFHSENEFETTKNCYKLEMDSFIEEIERIRSNYNSDLITATKSCYNFSVVTYRMCKITVVNNLRVKQVENPPDSIFNLMSTVNVN